MNGLHPQPLDPLTLPLQGAQVIEASAGTGKTWTLAALYVRLVLGHGRNGNGLLPPQILVMTFTEAATSELRGRVRARLAQAGRYFRGQEKGDDFLCRLRAVYPPEQWAQCAYRLDMAAQWMDDAAIFTIHGWSNRMLRQHAFDSGSLFQQSKVDDSEGLKLAAVRDYWRQWFYPLTELQLECLAKVARSPDELLKKLKPLWQAVERSPDAPGPAGEDPHALVRAWTACNDRLLNFEKNARGLCAMHWDALRKQLAQAMTDDLNGNVYRKGSHDTFLSQLEAWSKGAERDDKNPSRFCQENLTKNTKKGRPTPSDGHGVFAAIQRLCDCLGGLPEIEGPLLAHAADAVDRAYQQRKRQLAQFDFSDLLQCLYHAVHADGANLAQVLANQYPVALVDEFQDTDPWQYGALSRIYQTPEQGGSAGSARALIMIGDPKQAIYSFRGADLATYMKARQASQAIHSLAGNFRSTQQLVNAVNLVFDSAHQPFGELPFEGVQARNPDVVPLPLTDRANADQPAMTVWHAASEQPMTVPTYQQTMAELFASQMVDLLNRRIAIPGDMAVLVRDWREAGAIRAALGRRGVRSVYLSDRDSVYSTREATDLWHILRATAQPRSVAYLRAALTTRSFGMRPEELDALIADEAAWDAQVENFNRWHQTWQRQGFLAMLYQVLHEQEIPKRLTLAVPDPERRLTNLLHLGELLQKASMDLQSEGALVRYLSDQLQDPGASGDASQMRLETDANLVQVVTMHKSKGLQYPLVFLPFVSNFRAEQSGSGRDDEERMAEDVRLLYVALTRAQRALWLGVANRAREFPANNPAPGSALSKLLGRQAPDDLQHRLQQWAECSDIVVAPAPPPTDDRYTASIAPSATKQALTPTRRLRSDWWMASFSALTRDLGQGAAAGLPMAPTEDDERFMDAKTDSREQAASLADDSYRSATAAEAPGYNAFPAGSQYGTLLHDLLEWQLREGWPILHEPAATDTGVSVTEAQGRWERMLLARADSLKLDPDARDLLGKWIVQIANTELPLSSSSADSSGATLCLSGLNLASAWPEMGFTLLTHGVSAQAIDRLVGQHVQAGLPRPALLPRVLQGLLTGFMDLVFVHEGRYYVLDYKSNKLDAYGPEDLSQSILAHRYDVQYTLYLLALHRLLKARLPGYDYDAHMGGAVYLFARGIDQPGAGVHVDRPPRQLIEELDQAFSATHVQSAGTRSELA